MELSDITQEWIEDILEAQRKKQSLPDTIQRLRCLSAETEAEYEHAIIRLLHDYITWELIRRRATLKVSSLPGESLEILKKNIEQDARQRDPHLMIWSFMYYRYVSGDLSIKEASVSAKYSTGNHRLKIREGYRYLADYLRRLESEAHAALRHLRLQAQLGEPEYVQYIGRDESIERLVHHLRDPEGPRWISLEGVGGIGKTALARRLTEELTKQDASLTIIWLSARQQRFDPTDGTQLIGNTARTSEDLIDQLWKHAALQADTVLSLDQKIERLATWSSHLHAVIVIDNLETLQDVEAIRCFAPLAGQTRFVITSRESLGWLPYIMTHPIPELSPSDSELLLRREYKERKELLLKKRNPSATTFDEKALERIPLKEEHFAQIQKMVGGSPLALKLVAAQILTMPIDECLAGLQNITLQRRSEEMFTFIYRQTWTLLSLSARKFLLAVHDTLPSEGLPREWLGAMAEAVPLSLDEFETVLQQLMYFSLLELTPADQRYRLHRLTVTFLHNEFGQARL